MEILTELLLNWSVFQKNLDDWNIQALKNYSKVFGVIQLSGFWSSGKLDIISTSSPTWKIGIVAFCYNVGILWELT